MLGKGLLNQNTINSTGNYTNLFQDDEFSRKGYSHNLKFGMEYYLDDFNSFSGSVLFNTGTRDGSEVRTNTFTDGSLVNNYETNTSELFPMNSFDYRLGYKHNFGKRNNDLTVDFIYTPTTRNHTLNLYDPWPPVTSSDSITNTTNFIDNKAYVLQSDYINTFDKDTKIEAGLKVSYKDINNDYGYNNIINNVTIPNAALSNTFDYREFITALYASYSGTLGSFKYQAGLRSEYTSLNNRLLKPTDTTTHKNYLDFFPSAFLQYNFDEINAIQLNWTRRIDRPNPRQLNPFTDYSDPLNLEKGNPDLDPQYSNNFELGYLWISGKTTINPTAFFKYRTGDISDWKELIDSTNGITMTIPRNMNKSQSYGLDFIISHEFFKGWHADGNFSYFKQELFGSVPRTDAFNHILPDSSFTNSSNSWTMKLNTVVNLFGLADLQMSANYNSPVVTAQGTRDANWWADMGLKMDVLEGKGTINLRVSDIFNTQRWVHSSIGPGFYDTTNWKRVSQGAFLGFTYRFNDYKKAKDKHNGDNPGMDEDY
jgi:outer membrane receptor protein involved in Fe transport